VPLFREPQEDSLDAARRIARLVVESFLGDDERIGMDDRDDLVWMLVEHWWRHGDAFNSDGAASRDTYMRKMFRNKLLELRAGTTAAKRGQGLAPLSIDERVDSESDTTLAETVIDVGVDVEAMAANNELWRALTDLRPYLAKEEWELLEALWPDPRIRPASRTLGVHHTTGYAGLARIRAVAEERGLRQYL
jgi:hypothetical protein